MNASFCSCLSLVLQGNVHLDTSGLLTHMGELLLITEIVPDDGKYNYRIKHMKAE